MVKHHNHFKIGINDLELLHYRSGKSKSIFVSKILVCNHLNNYNIYTSNNIKIIIQNTFPAFHIPFKTGDSNCFAPSCFCSLKTRYVTVLTPTKPTELLPLFFQYKPTRTTLEFFFRLLKRYWSNKLLYICLFSSSRHGSVSFPHNMTRVAISYKNVDYDVKPAKMRFTSHENLLVHPLLLPVSSQSE